MPVFKTKPVDAGGGVYKIKPTLNGEGSGGQGGGEGIMMPIGSISELSATPIPLNLVHIYYLTEEDEEIELPQTILDDTNLVSCCYINEQPDIEKTYTFHITVDEGIGFGSGGSGAGITPFWTGDRVNARFKYATRDTYIENVHIGYLTISNSGSK